VDVTGGDDALLVAQIEALRAEGCPDDELFDAYRELVALRLRSDDLGAAQLAVDELLLLAERATALQRVDAQHLAMLVALGRGDAETAIAHGRWTAAKMRALALDGDHPHMLFQLSRALRLSGQHEQARTTLQEAVEGFEATEQPLYASLATLQLR
jgi:hypothetical protein